MKKITEFSFIIALIISCNTPASKEQQIDQPVESKSSANSTTQSVDTVVTKEAESEKSRIVYVTHDGDKYHTADCRYSKDADSVSLKQAKANGKTACDLCKPNSVTGDKQIRCSAKTADGTQCKRMTTHASGRCFQHNKP